MKTFVVAYREFKHSEVSYYAMYAETAQAAVDYVRYDLCAYEVLECYREVKNWK